MNKNTLDCNERKSQIIGGLILFIFCFVFMSCKPDSYYKGSITEKRLHIGKQTIVTKPKGSGGAMGGALVGSLFFGPLGAAIGANVGSESDVATSETQTQNDFCMVRIKLYSGDELVCVTAPYEKMWTFCLTAVPGDRVKNRGSVKCHWKFL